MYPLVSDPSCSHDLNGRLSLLCKWEVEPRKRRLQSPLNVLALLVCVCFRSKRGARFLYRHTLLKILLVCVSVFAAVSRRNSELNKKNGLFDCSRTPSEEERFAIIHLNACEYGETGLPVLD